MIQKAKINRVVFWSKEGNFGDGEKKRFYIGNPLKCYFSSQ